VEGLPGIEDGAVARRLLRRLPTRGSPVSHATRRQGRPYTLVLAKTDALFAEEQAARARDQSDLDWLAAKWAPGTPSERSGR
jgi:hypothetical protein